MPGMMDTVLNVGASWDELTASIEAVCASWNSERAVEYRDAHGISERLGTAINIQTMVFGNKDDRSGTGVVFSRNIITGQEDLYGEFLVCAQGDELVSGTRTPQPIVNMKEWNSELFAELVGYTRQLDDHYGYPVEIEFTVESGKLWLLQVRRAKLTARAAATVAVHDVWAKKVDRISAIKRLSADEYERLSRQEFDTAATEIEKASNVCLVGLPASPGAAVGRPVYSSEEAVRLSRLGHAVILVRHDTSPDDLPGMLVSKGIVTSTGGATSHAAIVAVSLGIPAVVGVNVSTHHLRNLSTISVDGTAGYVYFKELPLAGQQARTKELSLFIRWAEQSGVFRTKPTIDFTAIDREVSVNTMLRDFYLSAAMAREAVGTILEVEARRQRDAIHKAQAEFLACYVLLAVAGELRHAIGKVTQHSPTWLLVQSLVPRFGILADTTGEGRLASQLGLLKKLMALSDREDQMQFVQEFLTTAIRVFSDKSIWGGGGYGGARWAVIAQAPQQFLAGEINNTVFVDHAFDLRHNGNKMFNKHRMVSAKTNESSLQFELDVKKRVMTSRQLVEKLVYGLLDLSPENRKLWLKGQAQGLW
jgi:phosphohistidine swiveling domain-containing protein